MAKPSGLLCRCAAEGIGTFLLVFFGCGSVHTAVLMGAQSGVWQVAVVWGVAITVAAFVVGGISGAHLNPAVTIALAAWNRFAWSDVVFYIFAQVSSAFGAAAVLFFLFQPFLTEKEREKRVERGRHGSEITAMCYGEYFPNVGALASGSQPLNTEELDSKIGSFTTPAAMGAEFLGTLILGLVIFAITDNRNSAAPQSRLGPVFIGLTVSILISVLAPLTQACFNPARDFGPRLFAFFAGWGPVALPGPNGSGFFTVYILAPILGAVTGGGVYDKMLRSAFLNHIPPRGDAA